MRCRDISIFVMNVGTLNCTQSARSNLEVHTSKRGRAVEFDFDDETDVSIGTAL